MTPTAKAASASALADGDPALFLRAVSRHRLAVLLPPHAGSLPSFEALWLEREMVSLNGHAVLTLGRRLPFSMAVCMRPLMSG
ncbi:MAG: hypothetical protein NTW51_06585 [Cyanobacteria bacterium]|nr:hypothetical protein [Cyanobacteriota bacterium]